MGTQFPHLFIQSMKRKKYGNFGILHDRLYKIYRFLIQTTNCEIAFSAVIG